MTRERLIQFQVPKDILPNQNGAIIQVNDTSKRVNFDSWPDIADQKSANWTLIPILGRAEPIPMYQSSGARGLGVNLRLAAGLEKGDTEKDLNERLNFLKSLTYPGTVGLDEAFYVHPPLVWVICGEHINVKAFAQDISVAYNNNTPWGNDDDVVTHPLVVDVKMKFVVVNDYLPNSNTVRDSGDNYQGASAIDIRGGR